MDAMPTMQDWRRLAAADGLSGSQLNWFAKTKPVEELYDTEQDPWELNNLAGLSQYQDRLSRMRLATQEWQDAIGDTGLIPEALLMEEMAKNHPTPQTAIPEIELIDGHLRIQCSTEGSSIVYREVGADGKTQPSSSPSSQNWRLYTKSFPSPASKIEVLASRLGYSNSPITHWPKEN
jgi:N-sulfoglucosamine sulfohydrolase